MSIFFFFSVFAVKLTNRPLVLEMFLKCLCYYQSEKRRLIRLNLKVCWSDRLKVQKKINQIAFLIKRAKKDNVEGTT